MNTDGRFLTDQSCVYMEERHYKFWKVMGYVPIREVYKCIYYTGMVYLNCLSYTRNCIYNKGRKGRMIVLFSLEGEYRVLSQSHVSMFKTLDSYQLKSKGEQWGTNV